VAGWNHGRYAEEANMTVTTSGAQAGQRHNHPGSGRRKAPVFTKGRQLEAEALAEVRALLGEGERRRDLLIEYLHAIQDKYGSLSAAHLQALAEDMHLAMAEVYEVATFYAHFDVVLDGEAAPAPLTIRVCDSLTCEMMGAKALLEELQGKLGREVRVVPAPCMGRCENAPVAEVGHRHVVDATVETLVEAAGSGDTHPVIPAYVDLDAYRADGGYRLLEACLKGDRDADDIVKTMQDSGLRGLGGAGFPSGLKWKIIREAPKPRVMAVNGDEGEPGTFKDRYYMETDPHRFIEGMLVAAWAAEIERVYVYIRDEYPGIIEVLKKELEAVEKAAAAPQAALPHPSWAVRPADPAAQRGNAVLGSRHSRKGRGLVRRRGPQRAQGPALLLGLGPGQRARRQAGPGRHHDSRIDRGVLRRHGGRSHLQGLPAGRRLGRHPARQPGRHPARFRHLAAV
jgi:formate dehydrogenase